MKKIYTGNEILKSVEKLASQFSLWEDLKRKFNRYSTGNRGVGITYMNYLRIERKTVDHPGWIEPRKVIQISWTTGRLKKKKVEMKRHKYIWIKFESDKQYNFLVSTLGRWSRLNKIFNTSYEG